MMLTIASIFLTQLSLVQGVLSAYDYIIVGGGNGGLVVASRLSEEPNVNVLVLEAGKWVEDLPEVYIPGMIGAGQAFTTLNWAYQTLPQKNMDGRNFSISAGKALGGSTIINSMIMTRATRAQYNALGELNNSTAWTWDALLPFFKESEIITLPNSYQASHGASFDQSVRGPTSSNNTNQGRVKVGFPNFFFPQSDMFARALISTDDGGLGFQRAVDLCDGDVQSHVGVNSNALDASNNTRCSSVCGFITPFIDQRPNLHIVTGAMVSRIEWANEKKNGLLIARRVEYFLDGNPEPQYAEVNADDGGEVILSAGTIGTPKVMELSGVGNSSYLKSVGVSPVLDLPSVGENLADHIHSWASAVTNASITKDVLASNGNFQQEQLALWEKNRTGLYSAAPRTIGLAGTTDLLPRDRITPLLTEARRDLDRYATEFANGNDALRKGIKAQHQIVLSLYEKDHEIPIELNVAPPAVNPAYWSHPLDRAMQTAGLQTARKVLRTPPLDSILVEEFEPGPAVGESDEKVEAYLRTVAASDSHEVGTMAMMPQEFGGVVDTRFKVYGISNARVVDASIIPMPLSAHLMSTTYMLGEKAATLIRDSKAINSST
ncbi:hypothetical protein NP233_g6722 [Leucocoprinus birnbaumii]|uniref:pyranose dehydrogenase (acceptor) n=1 Tax=Leucocoprinus birnbaumii TaxID=56174 RepID=A0AAD5VSV1_9AGAR|nr:hypothetical protein NP233_g6722 [Leucocoprinus birnbaumii]